MAIEPAPIMIVGCGPGSPDYLTRAAISAVEGADFLIGAQRLLDLFPSHKAQRFPVTGRIQDSLDAIEGLLGKGRIAVLVTGDPGFFSLARPIMERFGQDRCRVIPGISSVQTAFARLGLDWADAKMISAHKADPEPDESLDSADKIAVLCGRKGSLQWIADRLMKRRWETHSIFLCENLTLEDERIREALPSELETMEISTTALAVIVRKSGGGD